MFLTPDGEPAVKIAIATKDFASVSGHAGQARCWLVYDLAKQGPDQPLPTPERVELAKDQLFHHFEDKGPHPLDGVEIVVAASAGDGFVRHMQKRGAEVLLTGETDPAAALKSIIAGEALPDQRFDLTTSLCKLRDLFSRH
jgi:predicted Fe-Mo cluster-binding NifX family protein